MSRPTFTKTGSKLSLKVPPGWFVTIAAISREKYFQVIKITDDVYDDFSYDYMGKRYGTNDLEPMKVIKDESDSYAYAAQKFDMNISLEFFYFPNKNDAFTAKLTSIAKPPNQSRRIDVLSVDRPESAKNKVPDYTTLMIFVEDTEDQAANDHGIYDDGRPSYKVNGSNLTVTVPADWCCTIASVEQENYQHVVEIVNKDYDLGGRTLMSSARDKPGGILKDYKQDQETSEQAAVTYEWTFDINVFYSKAEFDPTDLRTVARTIAKDPNRSYGLQVFEATKSKRAPKEVPDFVNLIVFVEDSPPSQQVGKPYDDMIVTVQMTYLPPIDLSNEPGPPNPKPPPPPAGTHPGYNPAMDYPRPKTIENYLKYYDTIFLIDDSGSMAEGNPRKWDQLKKALIDLANTAIDHDTDGIDMYFLNSNDVFKMKDQIRNVIDKPKVQQALDRVGPDGGTPTGQRVGERLQDHLRKIDAVVGNPEYREVKPLDLIVITDGKPTDDPKSKEEIEKAAKYIRDHHYHPNHMGIQFVQIGNDQGADVTLNALKSIDNNLTAMARPTTSLPGGPVVNIEVPPGWLTTITVVSRQPYNQLARLRYTTRGITNTQYFADQSGKANVIMEDLITGYKTFAIAGQSDSTTVNFSFFYSKDPKMSGRNLENKKYYSSQISLVSVTKPKKAPAGTPDYVTYFVFVENTNQSAGKGNAVGNFDDMVATVNIVQGEVPPAPDKAVYEQASQAIGDFQFSTGIPDEDLGPPPPYVPPEDLAKLPVGILGAGAAGMYTAMILDSLGIKYEILEASGRHGGRLYTHYFPKVPGPYQYFDAGAMRYPDIDFMKRTFKLVDGLNLRNKLLEVIMGNDNAFVHFNGIRATRKQYSANWAPGATPLDTFKVAKTASNPDGYIPEEYILKGHKKLYDDAIKPLKEPFATSSFQDAYKNLLEFDKYSVKSYLSIKMGYPDSVIRWIETMEWRTGMFDAGLLDTVLADLAFDDPRNRAQGKETKWYCFDGGSRVLADAMLEKVLIKPKYYQRVTVIREAYESSNQAIVVTVDGRDDPRLANNYTADKKYSNVICTLPLSVLRTVDLDRVHLSANQRNGLRELLYSPSIKIGIQFKTAWWEKKNQIIGGQTYTDRPARAVVYPSHGPGLAGSQKSNVLIASYNGMQDSQRLGALMKGRDTPEEKMLLNLIMNDLSVIHGVSLDELWDQFIDYYPWDWYSSSLSLGAFGWFGPGQFKDIYPHLTLPASVKQRLFFAGDALSANHGWVVGALNSAWRCVYSMLKAHPELNPNPKEDIIQKFLSSWGDTEEWDNKVLEKHVYIGRELTKRQLTQTDPTLPPYKPSS
ncbi:hypothetical protein M422DRAFT_778531 [Sphaerobolus stellatus SS14]|uniref:VWFA domain-containing protein n=1 Tax=Sphaerobolus stellatus (strain SS14) TaxID=990650 RepID=A0A0C9VUA6_SPHS4|nr:hypothetical protein M422DRAFT_778531 [Sphaerobolus stellatus SS14]